jgi:type I restriction enzyme R subunit
VQKQIGTDYIQPVTEVIEINEDTIEAIKNREGGDGNKVINLVKSIEKTAEEESDDPCLIAMAERARAVQESFENRQASTAEALQALLKEIGDNEQRKKEQAEKGFDGLTFFVYRTMLDSGIDNAEEVSKNIKQAFVEYPNWKVSENALRELRKKVTFAIFAQTDDLDTVTAMVDELFMLLEKAERI